MTCLGLRIPLPLPHSMPGNLHDRLFLSNSKFAVSKKPSKTQSNVRRKRYSWLGPGNLIIKGSRLNSSNCIYIGIE